MTSIRIFFSYNNNEKVVQAPVIPDKLPEILQELSNDEFTTHTNKLSSVGNIGALNNYVYSTTSDK